MSEVEALKSCYKCLRQLPPTEFYRNKAMPSGRVNQCKECSKAYTRQHRAENREYYLEFDRARGATPKRAEARRAFLKTGAGKEMRARAQKNYSERHPEKRQAQHAVSNALRDGKLVKQPCQVCGSTVKVEGHHIDYSFHLGVVWLCEHHHKMAHGQIKERN